MSYVEKLKKELTKQISEKLTLKSEADRAKKVVEKLNQAFVNLQKKHEETISSHNELIAQMKQTIADKLNEINKLDLAKLQESAKKVYSNLNDIGINKSLVEDIVQAGKK